MSYCSIVQINGGTRKNTFFPPWGLVLCQVIGSANVCSSNLEGISWLVAVSTVGHCGKPTYKCGHSVTVNTAWFSSRLHVEARRRPDLQWLGVAMAMSLLLVSCLHVALTCLLLHGEFYGFCCQLYWFWGRLIFQVKQRWFDKEPRDMTLKRGVLAVLSFRRVSLFLSLCLIFEPDFLCSRQLPSDGTKSLWFKLSWWEPSLFLISYMMITLQQWECSSCSTLKY